MEDKLKLFVNEIMQKTGLEIAVFDSSGECVAGRKGEHETVNTSISDVYSDTLNGRTLFPIIFKDKKYVGRIAKAGDAEIKYARLIASLSENRLVKKEHYTKADFYKGLLYGEISFSEFTRFIGEYKIEDEPCYALLIKAEKTETVLPVIESFSVKSKDFCVKVGLNKLCYVKYVDGDLFEYRSVSQFGENLKRIIYEETGEKVKIFIGGTVGSLKDVSISFSQTLEAERLQNADKGEGDIHSYKEYFVLKILEELPKHKLSEYYSYIADENVRQILNDQDMVITAEEFFKNNLNVSETARKLYMHRNTLIYRLEKIEKATGLNICSFTDAVTFKIITLIYKLTK